MNNNYFLVKDLDINESIKCNDTRDIINHLGWIINHSVYLNNTVVVYAVINDHIHKDKNLIDEFITKAMLKLNSLYSVNMTPGDVI